MSVNRILLDEQYAVGRHKARFLFISTPATPLTLSLADTLSQSESLRISFGLGQLITDSITITDSLIRIGYGLHLFDTNTLTDLIKLGYGLHFFDSLTFTDAFVTPTVPIGLIIPGESLLLIDKLVRIGYGLHLFDSNGNFSDGIIATQLFVNLQKVLTGESLSFTDSLIGTALIVNLLQVINDSINNFADAIISSTTISNLVISLSDSANNWADQLAFSLGRLIKLFDNLSQSDQFKFQVAAAVILGDALTILDSFKSSSANVSRVLADVISFQDQIRLFGPAILSDPDHPPFNDSINNYEDALTPVLGLNVGLGDALTFNDTLIMAHVVPITLELNDSLFLTDGISTHIEGVISDVNYLRRYLNDTIGIQPSGDLPDDIPPGPSTIRDMLRRYLNDDI